MFPAGVFTSSEHVGVSFLELLIKPKQLGNTHEPILLRSLQIYKDNLVQWRTLVCENQRLNYVNQRFLNFSPLIH